MRNSITNAIAERNVIVDRGLNADRRTVVVSAGDRMVRATHMPTRYLYTPLDFTSKRGAEKRAPQSPMQPLQSRSAQAHLGRLCLALCTGLAASSLAASWRAGATGAGSRRRGALTSQLARFRG